MESNPQGACVRRSGRGVLTSPRHLLLSTRCRSTRKAAQEATDALLLSGPSSNRMGRLRAVLVVPVARFVSKPVRRCRRWPGSLHASLGDVASTAWAIGNRGRQAATS